MNYKKNLLLSCSILGAIAFSGHSALAQNGTFTNTLNFESSTTQYNWVLSSWTECRANPTLECGTGTQDRTYECIDNSGNAVSDHSLCEDHTPISSLGPFTRDCAMLDRCTWQFESCTLVSSPPPPSTGGGFGGDGGCCFTAGTKVTMADGSVKNIEDIIEGDEVIGMGGDVHTVQNTVVSSLKGRTIIAINGGDYFPSCDHVFKTKDGWASADPEMTNENYPEIIADIGGIPDKLDVGTILLTADGEVEVTSVEHKTGDHDLPLYDFGVDKTHTYYANGFLVHNASGCPEPTGGGGGGGGGSALCGHYYTRGILPGQIYYGDVAYSARNVSDETRRGYWYWAVPLTHYLNNNPGGLVEKALKPIVLGWAQEMAYKTGYAKKGSLIGKTLLTMVPMVSVLGRFVDEKDPSDLASERKIRGAQLYQEAEKTVAKYNSLVLSYS